MYDLIIIGAGPGGIALAAEASASGIDRTRTLVLEKAAMHNSAIRQFYPEQKLTTANYKGFHAVCEGLLCITDMTKAETLEYFDRVIVDYGLNLQYGAEVYSMRPIESESGQRFRIESSKGTYDTRILAIAIGILGRPNKPRDYKLPPKLKERLLFDITSQPIHAESVLVVGGGDSAAEYVDNLFKQGNLVTMSYRGSDFTRLNDLNRAMLHGMEERAEVQILRGSNVKEVADEDGRPRIIFNEEQFPAGVFDRVVFALGGTTPSNFLRMLGINFNDKGAVFDESGESNVAGLFLLGDLIVGKSGGSIITAFNSAVSVMERICSNHLLCTASRTEAI